MKRRWYISTFIILLTILGAVHQQHVSIPNQEIIVQFTDVDVSSDEAKSAIANVKEQLQILGADNIYIKQGAEGRLKITYYSDADIASIKETLSKASQLKLDQTTNNKDQEPLEIPSNDNTIGYNFDVYEIQNGNDTNWDIDGIFVLELKPESDRLFNPNVYGFSSEVIAFTRFVKTAYKVNRNMTLTLSSRSYNIPEVRAGPIC